jgi:GDP-L-fucose synthase
MFEDRGVLVAGGSGFIGTHLCRRLAALGARVRATRHQSPMRFDDPAVETVEADLREPEACRRAVAGIDYVFMCAANTSGAAVMRGDPLAHVTPNVVMNAQILQAAYEAGVRKFLFVSSGAAYPPTGERAVREEEMFDGEPYEAYYSVAWMKRYAEILCRIYAEKIAKPMATVIVRPSNVYGPDDKFDFRTSHVTAALIRRVVERHRPLEVWGTGEDVRDLIYIDDFLDGLLAAFAHGDRYLAINICSGRGVSVKEILQTAIAVDGFTDADIRFDPSKPSTIPVRRMSGEMAKRVLGFEARTSLEEGLRRTIAWLREHPFIDSE